MVRTSKPHKVLVKCNVLFLGYSPPTENAFELDSLRDPLRKAYPAHRKDELEGINSWLTIYTSGIQLQLADGNNPPVFWFPIQNLYIAAANKCVNYIDATTGAVRDNDFVQLGQSEAEQSSHAPLFSFVSRSSGNSSSMQCYTFMTKNDESAFSLVNAAEFAYTNKDGHTKDKITPELAAKEVVLDSDDSASSISGSEGPRVINVDDDRQSETADLFPRRLIRKQKLELLRPRRSSERRDRRPPSPPNQYVGRPNQYVPPPNPSRPYPGHGYSPVQRTPRQPFENVQERLKVVQPPPLFIKAPPPRVMVVKEPPRIIQTPPQIVKQVEMRPYPVDREVIKEVEVEVPMPYPVRSPTPPPVYIQSEPRIVEREVPIEVPVEVPVPYEVRSPTPPPRYITEIVEREVPVPYEVRSPTPPPQIIEVPVQVPVYIEVEGPPQLIREPPQIQEIPVPYPVEMPYQVPVEVPHFYPVPLKDRSRKKRRERRRNEYYDDYYLDRGYDRGHFIPQQFREQPVYWDRPEPRDNRRSRHRRERSGSSGSSSPPGRRGHHSGNRDYGLSNRFSDIRLSEREERRRPEPRREDRRDDRRGRGDHGPDEADGFDYYYYRPEPRTSKKERSDERGNYYVRERRISPRRPIPDYDRERAFSPRSISDGRTINGQMPAHLSDSISEFQQPPPTARSRRYFY